MYAEERQQAIASLVISQGRASVAELAQANDVTTETFTLDDATELADFARSKGVGWLSMWSVGRDRECPEGPKDKVDSGCSSVEQDAGAFSAALAAVQTR